MRVNKRQFLVVAALSGCSVYNSGSSQGAASSDATTTGTGAARETTTSITGQASGPTEALPSTTGLPGMDTAGTTDQASTDSASSCEGPACVGSPSSTSSDATLSTLTAPTDCGDPEGQVNNATCMDGSGCGCESGKCFIVPALGGYCGECVNDADCAMTDGGCTVPNLIAAVGATCNMGEAGAGCETAEACSTPEASVCGLVIGVPGIIEVSTCGACATNNDCIAINATTRNCSPTYDLMNFSGQYVCVKDGSVPNDGGCNLAPDAMDLPIGNLACTSGFCGEANVMGLVKLGICGECNSDADCVKIGKLTCSAPLVDFNPGTQIGSTCS